MGHRVLGVLNNRIRWGGLVVRNGVDYMSQVLKLFAGVQVNPIDT